jgi:XTP/dITP diphosphohydrolase
LRTLIVGTQNPGKLKELEAILIGGGLRVRLATLPGHVQPPDETEATLAANAALKATHYARATGEWTLADDTGLEVDALDGAPGVQTAYYGGPEADPAKNRAKLLRALKDVPEGRRSARFRCVVALADPTGAVRATAEGVLEGAIAPEGRGAGGFGYDPLFLLTADEPRGQTLAELADGRKNTLSHRARALAGLRPRLLELLA